MLMLAIRRDGGVVLVVVTLAPGHGLLDSIPDGEWADAGGPLEDAPGASPAYRLKRRAGALARRISHPVGGSFYSPLSNRRRVMRGSMAAELSTLSEKAGATRIPRTLSAGTPLDSRFPM